MASVIKCIQENYKTMNRPICIVQTNSYKFMCITTPLKDQTKNKLSMQGMVMKVQEVINLKPSKESLP